MTDHKPSKAELEFLSRYDGSRYERPAVTVDVVVLRRRTAGKLEVLLIKRRNHPYRGWWALPGGFLDVGDDVDLADAAARELEEETGLVDRGLVLLGCFGRIGRDPRGRTVSAAYLCLAPPDLEAHAADDAAASDWLVVSRDDGGRPLLERRGKAVRLAFDHQEIISEALAELRRRADAARPFLELVPGPWSADELGAWVEDISPRSAGW